jgi:tripartite-type tricarboxylate transporter receptor subunit TctC
MFDVIMTSLPHVQTGKLRTLGISGLKRSPITPDVPTIAESGFPGYEAMVWFAFFAPANTPADVVRRINEETARALQSPRMREILASQGLEVVGGSPADLGKRVSSEIGKWRKVIQEAGIKLDY